MSYTESSSQTVKMDPDHCIKNYDASPRQTGFSSCVEEDERGTHGNLDTPASSSIAPLDEQLERRVNPTTREDFATLETELTRWRSR